MFKNKTENEVNKIEYTGDIQSDIKNLKISNQGGLVVFRYAIENIGNYISNDDAEINHNDLLKKLNIENDNLKFKVSFDIIINLHSGKNYKATVNLDLPVGDVINKWSTKSRKLQIYRILFLKELQISN